MKFTFENLQRKTVTLVIEPWAMAEQVPPRGKVIFEVADQPPPYIEFALTEEVTPLFRSFQALSEFTRKGKTGSFHLPINIGCERPCCAVLR